MFADSEESRVQRSSGDGGMLPRRFGHQQAPLTGWASIAKEASQPRVSTGVARAFVV
jgi:hypothetical protein